MPLSAFLVEDHADTRDTLVEAIQELAPIKFTGVAGSEADARQWLASNRWDIAIVDIHLAKGSGFGVLTDCIARSNMQKVVVLTGHGDEFIRRRCIELGADAFFFKDCDMEKLVDFCKVHAAYIEFMRDNGLLPPAASGWINPGPVPR